MRSIEAAELRALVPMPAAIDALRKAFADLDRFIAPPRSVVTLAQGDLLLMPAADRSIAGVKLVTVNPANVERGEPLLHALYVLLDEHLAPAALIDGEALTALRTGALSALATDLCAPAAARRLLVFGAGAQARAHVEAMGAIRQVEEVTIVSRGRERAEAFVRELRDSGLDARVGLPDDVSDAHIICTCTTSPEPLFDGSLVAPGAHVNSVGAYRPDARETDDALVQRARVVVETRAAAMAEAGDIVIPVARGVLDPDDILELADLVSGVAARRDDEDVTFFKSVGSAVEDLAVAGAAYAALNDEEGR